MCYRSCDLKNKIKAESNGWRGTFYYPGGGTYQGCWLNSQNDRYGVKTNTKGLTYDGQWKANQRHGHGTMRRPLANGTWERIYVGAWRNDMKCGEGKHFYPDGIYYGWWKDNRRHGLGIKWYRDGRIYLGEWNADVYHGLGVLFCANGNRYEGNFARGFKNGEGTFYHMHSGQIQKGTWDNDICKDSMMMDEFRNQADQPTKYPIPQCTLAHPDHFIRHLFQKHMPNSERPPMSFKDTACHQFLRKMKRYAKLEPHAVLDTNINLDDVFFPCTCKSPEKVPCLHRL